MDPKSNINSAVMPKNIENISILLLEDNPEDVRLIQAYFAEAKSMVVDLKVAGRLETGLKEAKSQHFDLILIDLSLPDSQGFSTFTQLQAQAEGVPIVILSGIDDEAVALEAVHKGAQDYLAKSDLSAKRLTRVVRYAIERGHMQEKLMAFSITDEMTKLFNRRGFIALGNQLLKLAKRTKKGLFFILADINGLKAVNDAVGHLEGDQLINGSAEVLRETFRQSDIVARIGGDEFAILAINTRPNEEQIIKRRLETNLEKFNESAKKPYVLSLGVGIAFFDPIRNENLDELMVRADKALQENKE